VKIALIPPIPDLHRIPQTGFHLLLTHLLEDERYLKFYQERRIAGDYLILDNSAHEKGLGEGGKALLRNATLLKAQEVVLPDILFDRKGTVERTRQALKWIAGDGWNAYLDAGMPRLMMVPQAKERAEWSLCLEQLFRVWELWYPRMPFGLEEPVIGISKDYDTWRGGLVSLLSDYVAPHWHDRLFDVHCLGWPNNLWSIAKVQDRFGADVRSTDSAKAFVFAKNHILLEPGGKCPKYPRRDKNYFSESLTEEQWGIALRNIEVFQAAAENEVIIPQEA
jgi:hypothetical protein